VEMFRTSGCRHRYAAAAFQGVIDRWRIKTTVRGRDDA
jgi:hypothetical protein